MQNFSIENLYSKIYQEIIIKTKLNKEIKGVLYLVDIIAKNIVIIDIENKSPTVIFTDSISSIKNISTEIQNDIVEKFEKEWINSKKNNDLDLDHIQNRKDKIIKTATQLHFQVSYNDEEKIICIMNELFIKFPYDSLDTISCQKEIVLSRFLDIFAQEGIFF
ncbi:gem-associated protein [Anaeramoeba ignava]|uniref:Gem-associated protein n=1 Tax=Anaeramoeba ignava TaxID=1746090 RepID=A0A9Q0R5R4_ANAIG|nr:gem-associated protein [Anaeramoeba ignava]